MPKFMIVICRLRSLLLLAGVALCWVGLATAGDLSFGLSRVDNRLLLVNQGNAPAFYPSVLRLLADGRWEPLPLPVGQVPIAELPAKAQMAFQWPALPAATNPLENSAPMMVRFYDQAGSGFGQISFFNQPPLASSGVKAAYQNGSLIVQPPGAAEGAIQRSWLLWAQEEGIRSLSTARRFESEQPAARRIDWQKKDAPLRLNLGAGQPVAMLLHETPRGLELQVVPGGGLQGREQRSAWLDAGRLFYGLAALAVGIALLLGVGQLGRLWRKRNAA